MRVACWARRVRRTTARLSRGSALLLLLLSGLPVSASAVPAVVVTSKPVHALVAAVMAGIATPGLLVDGNASPHSYSLRPSQARELQAADVFIRVSGAIEPFSDDLIRTLPKTARVLTLAEQPGVRELALRTGAAFAEATHEHDHGDGHEHEHEHAASGGSARDGHIWLDPENAKAIAVDVAKVLGDVDAANAERYRSNADALVQRIDQLSREIASELAPVRDKPFVVLHDATQYFEIRFGLHAVGAIQLSPLVSPSAKRLSAVRARIKALNAVCVLSEPWLRSGVVDTAVEGTDARVAMIDPEAIALDPGPDLYFTLMRGLAASLRKCLS